VVEELLAHPALPHRGGGNWLRNCWPALSSPIEGEGEPWGWLSVFHPHHPSAGWGMYGGRTERTPAASPREGRSGMGTSSSAMPSDELCT